MANPTGINGSASKPFKDALRIELAAAGDNSRQLRALARTLIQRALNGDSTAMSMLIDRVDGKVPQPVGGSDELGPTRLHISWKAEPTEQVEALEPPRLRLTNANSSAQAVETVEQLPKTGLL